jgi:hypothetical protein
VTRVTGAISSREYVWAMEKVKLTVAGWDWLAERPLLTQEL